MQQYASLSILPLVVASMALAAVAAPPLPPAPPVQEPATKLMPPRERLQADPVTPPHREAGAWALGVRLDEVPDLLAMHLPQVLGEQRGALVGDVDPSGPAGRSLTPGDVVLRFNDLPVNSRKELAGLIRRNGPRPVELTVLHAGELRRVHARPEWIPAPAREPVTTSATAINVTTPGGSVAVSGTDGHYQLKAEYLDPDGRRVRIDRAVTRQELQSEIDRLPSSLRRLVQSRLSEPKPGRLAR